MIITIDFETFYSKEFSLSKISTEEYIRDSQFEVIGVAVKVDDRPSMWASGTHEEIKSFLDSFPFADAAVLAHNTMFDGAILNWAFGIRPKVLLDTMSMGRALHGVEAGASLKAMTERYGLGAKGTEVLAAIGKRRADFTEEELSRYGDYCINDVELTYKLFHCMMEKGFPKDELKLIDLTLRMFTEPVIDLNLPLLEEHLGEVRQRREDLMKACGLENRDVLMSNPKFADLLKSFDVEPPTKISPITGRKTWAFAKNDEGFQALVSHPDERVQALVAARLGNKSTLEETRTERFIEIAKRGPMPVPLRYYAAHTGRWGGMDFVNLQNLTSRGVGAGKLKLSMQAPEGYVFIDSDSSQIEARVLAWLAGQEDAVDTFRKNNEEIRAGINKKNFQHDPYKLMASKIFNVPTTEVTDAQRFIGKATILGSGYGMGAMRFQEALRVAGRVEDLDECRRIINTYREANENIVQLWGEAQATLIALFNGEVEKEYFGLHRVVKLVHDEKALELPSGLLLRYTDLKMENTEKGPQFDYAGRHGRNKIYGGKVVENVVQALARCIIGEQMRLIAKKYKVVLTVHDAVACIAPEVEADAAQEYVEECMRWVPEWAQGLPVNCESGVDKSYGGC